MSSSVGVPRLTQQALLARGRLATGGVARMDEGTEMRALGHWATGTLALTFPCAVVERRMAVCDAANARELLRGTRRADALGAYTQSWLQIDRRTLLFSCFDVDEDGGWGLTPNDRHFLAAVGHPHGILISLLDLWAASEPIGAEQAAYGGVALLLLHERAKEGLPFPRWSDEARRLEGPRGAALAEEEYEFPIPGPTRDFRYVQTSRAHARNAPNAEAGGGALAPNDAADGSAHRSPDRQGPGQGEAKPQARGRQDVERE